MEKKWDKWIQVLIAVAFATILVGIGLAFFYAPIEGTLGIVQKIFYFHVPSAIASYLGYFFCSLGSIVYLIDPDQRWADQLGRAGAEIGVLFSIMVLITGPLWGYKSWGDFWEWDPRLTSMLLTFFIYCAYLLLRYFDQNTEISRKISAVMGTLGMVGVGLVHVSVRLWGGVHPEVLTGKGQGLHPHMMVAFLVCLVGFLMLSGLLIFLRMRIQALWDKIDDLHISVSDIEYQKDCI